MKYINSLLVLSTIFFFLNGCGSNHTSDKYVQEVNGPAGDFVGATEFEAAMFADWQTIYTYDEKDSIWIGVVFTPQGNLIYESNKGIEESATYSIDEGKLIVKDDLKNPTISLDIAEPTIWKVTGMDDDGRIWSDTWHLELKFQPEMIVGKCYLSEFIDVEEKINEKVCFTDTIFNIYTMDGTLKHSYPYKLEDNAIVVNRDTGKYTLYLMFIEDDTKLNVWYVDEVNDYANNSTWTASQ